METKIREELIKIFKLLNNNVLDDFLGLKTTWPIRTWLFEKQDGMGIIIRDRERHFGGKISLIEDGFLSKYRNWSNAGLTLFDYNSIHIEIPFIDLIKKVSEFKEKG